MRRTAVEYPIRAAGFTSRLSPSRYVLFECLREPCRTVSTLFIERTEMAVMIELATRKAPNPVLRYIVRDDVAVTGLSLEHLWECAIKHAATIHGGMTRDYFVRIHD